MLDFIYGLFLGAGLILNIIVMIYCIYVIRSELNNEVLK